MLSAWPYLGPNIYTCHVNVSNSKLLYVEVIGGNHLSGHTNVNVEGVVIRSQELHYIPKNTADFFSNLKCIQIRNSNLLTISSNELRQFPNLVILSLPENRLMSIDSELFLNSSQLQWIDFSANLITHVEKDLLASLKYLRYADFQQNICVDFLAFTTEDIRKLKFLLENCSQFRL